MSLPPINAALSDGEKVEALKRFRRLYGDELTAVEAELRRIHLARSEYEFVKQYIGEQPEVKDLLKEQERIDKLEKRRQHLGMLVGRLDAVLPKDRGQEQAANYQRF